MPWSRGPHLRRRREDVEDSSFFFLPPALHKQKYTSMHLMWFPVMGELRVRDWRAAGRMSDVHALHALPLTTWLPLTTADAQAVMF